MSNTILNPSVTNVENIAENSSVITIEPLANGYGQTLGNSIRRVLLSSIEGAAITAFRIEGVSHEFSTIAGVKEDVVEIMLNLKSVVLTSESDKPVEITIKKKGGVLTAGDIKGISSDVEVVNPDQLIATIDDPAKEIDLTIVVENGRGYQTIDESTTKRIHSDMIALDANFSPIQRVRYNVEKTRVGDNVDLDKLVVTIDTDGSITPSNAFEQAAAILVEQYKALAGKTVIADDDIATVGTDGASNLLSMPIEELGLSARTTNALISNEIKTVNDLVSLTDEELDDLKGFGAKAKDEVKARVAELEF